MRQATRIKTLTIRKTIHIPTPTLTLLHHHTSLASIPHLNSDNNPTLGMTLTHIPQSKKDAVIKSVTEQAGNTERHQEGRHCPIANYQSQAAETLTIVSKKVTEVLIETHTRVNGTKDHRGMNIREMEGLSDIRMGEAIPLVDMEVSQCRLLTCCMYVCLRFVQLHLFVDTSMCRR